LQLKRRHHKVAESPKLRRDIFLQNLTLIQLYEFETS
jgi:hypothetical protein